MNQRFSNRAFAFALAVFGLVVGYGSPVDSLRLVISTSNIDSIRASAYLSLGNHFIRTDKDSARINFREAVKLYRKIKQTPKTADILNSIGISFAMQGNQDSAIFYVSKSLEINEKLKDSLKVAFAYNNLGLMNTDRHDYLEGIEYLLKALTYKNNLYGQFPAQRLDIGSTELNIGIAFHYLKDYDNALKYYDLAKKSYANQNNELGVARASFQQANTYFDLNDYRTADSLYNYLYNQGIFETDPFHFGKILNNYAELMLAMGQNQKARELTTRAYELNLKQGNTRAMGMNLVRLGSLELILGNLMGAIDKGVEAYTISKENKHIYSEKQAASLLVDAYEKARYYKQALDYSKIHQVLSDSLYNSDKTSLVTEMEAKYQSAYKEKTILLQEVELASVKRSRQLFVLFLVLALIFAAFIFYHYRIRNRRNKDLKRIINTKDKLISIIAHDLKNPAIAQKMAIEQLLLNVDVIKDKDLHNSISALFKSSDSQVSLLLNLLNWAHTQTGPLKPNPVPFNLNEVVRKNMQLFFTSAHNKQIEILLEAEENLLVNADKSMINTVVRNLVSNAIKFSHPGQPVQIKIFSHSHRAIACEVKDTGIGMNAAKLEKLFNLEKRELSRGTSGEEGSGLGLILCKEMVEANGGHLKIESSANEGTLVVFTIPKLEN